MTYQRLPDPDKNRALTRKHWVVEIPLLTIYTVVVSLLNSEVIRGFGSFFLLLVLIWFIADATTEIKTSLKQINIFDPEKYKNGRLGKSAVELGPRLRLILYWFYAAAAILFISRFEVVVNLEVVSLLKLLSFLCFVFTIWNILRVVQIHRLLTSIPSSKSGE